MRCASAAWGSEVKRKANDIRVGVVVVVFEVRRMRNVGRVGSRVRGRSVSFVVSRRSHGRSGKNGARSGDGGRAASGSGSEGVEIDVVGSHFEGFADGLIA